MDVKKQLDDYFEYCEFVRGMTWQTMKTKRYVLNRFVNDTKIKSVLDITNAVINSWIKSQSINGVSGRTINARLNNLIAFVKFVKEAGVVVPVNLAYVRPVDEFPPRRVFYTRKQISQAIEYADEMTELLIRIAFDTGMRLTELTNLHINQISGRKIEYIGKGRKARVSFVSAKTTVLLNQYIKNNKITEFVFLNRFGERLSIDSVRYKMQQAFYAAGFEDFYPHALRHSFATDLQGNGATIFEAQKMLGHSKTETTERYLHALDSRLEEIYDRLHAGIN